MSEAFSVVVSHEQCNKYNVILQHSHGDFIQNKVLIKELINARPTVSAELNGPKDWCCTCVFGAIQISHIHVHSILPVLGAPDMGTLVY